MFFEIKEFVLNICKIVINYITPEENLNTACRNMESVNVIHFCSDFRYESKEIFELGVGFLSSDKFRTFN